ncbi:hypothetical protein QR680_018186 [Steinernema hermaphroditum]|uniref:G-protein coupled receptors family 1 profile domain-containing protein n=1 Tax=Steinernema hermaphroditum TaxID=289476 RepID=A0AA39LQB5_9BILA|nr:hypothetical protein QR680_018186 [Steinernema hermaphroditum]
MRPISAIKDPFCAQRMKLLVAQEIVALDSSLTSDMDWGEMEMLLFFIEGFIVVMVNIPVVCVIFFSPTLNKTKELMFIGGLCLADTVDAFGYIFAGIIRTHMYAIGTDESVTYQINCFYTSFVILFFVGYQFTAIMTLVVSLDRFAAVFYPSRQMRFSRANRFSVIAGVAAWSVLTWLVVWPIQANSPSAYSIVSAQCYIAKTFIRPVWGYIIGLRIVCISSSVLLYFPIAFKMNKMLKSDINDPQAKQQNKKLLRLTVTIAFTSCAALILLVIPDILMVFDIFGLSRYHIFFYLIGLNKCLLNVFIYTLRQRELRRALIYCTLRILHLPATKWETSSAVQGTSRVFQVSADPRSTMKDVQRNTVKYSVAPSP